MGVTTPGSPLKRFALLLLLVASTAASRIHHRRRWSARSPPRAAASAPARHLRIADTVDHQLVRRQWRLPIVKLRDHDKCLENPVVQEPLQPSHCLPVLNASCSTETGSLRPAIGQRDDAAVPEGLAPVPRRLLLVPQICQQVGQALREPFRSPVQPAGLVRTARVLRASVRSDFSSSPCVVSRSLSSRRKCAEIARG